MKTYFYGIVIAENKLFQNNSIEHQEAFKNSAKNNITIIVNGMASYVIFNIIGYYTQYIISIA